jgi:beta-lactamase class A
VGCFIFFLVWAKQSSKSLIYPIRENTTAYTFIKPLLAVGNDSDTPSVKYQSLYRKVTSFISDNSDPNGATSVYFSDLNAGGKFVIDENREYEPASLLKVVIMIAYLKQAETNAGLLNQGLTYQPTIARQIESVPFESPTKLVVGQSYPVETLIKDMIADSDNGAMNLLLDNIDDAYLSKVYTDLGLQGPQGGSDYQISAKSYSLFFRILYNATYLSDDMSEKALSILSQASFADGITAPLPKDMVVAHKFGEHVIGSGDQVTGFELHDCGIVYFPGKPYLLCVMTHGSSLASVEKMIQGISGLVYTDYKAMNGN